MQPSSSSVKKPYKNLERERGRESTWKEGKKRENHTGNRKKLEKTHLFFLPLRSSNPRKQETKNTEAEFNPVFCHFKLMGAFKNTSFTSPFFQKPRRMTNEPVPDVAVLNNLLVSRERERMCVTLPINSWKRKGGGRTI